jgi:hypothetical protein
LKLSPAFPEPYYFYGKVLAAKERKEDALSIMRKALEHKFSFLSTTTREEIEGDIKQLEAEVEGRISE